MAFYNEINDPTNFLIGFSRNPTADFGTYGKGYANAAKILANALLEKGHFADYDAYPVVFLFRHSFELYLKSFYFSSLALDSISNSETPIEQRVFTHNLRVLSDMFLCTCKKHFSEDVELLGFAQKVNILANEFENIDQDSFSYRYPTDKSLNSSTKESQNVNLRSFYETMDGFIAGLDSVSMMFDCTIEIALENFDATANKEA